jgi:hypothetical protein
MKHAVKLLAPNLITHFQAQDCTGDCTDILELHNSSFDRLLAELK